MNTFLNQNIKYLRKQRNLSQEKLSKVVNKDRSLIGHWEGGTREVTLEDIIKISEFFDVSIDKIIGTNLANQKNEILENEYETNLKKYALSNGAQLLIDKTSPLSAESALKIQSEIQKILLEEVKENNILNI